MATENKPDIVLNQAALRGALDGCSNGTHITMGHRLYAQDLIRVYIENCRLLKVPIYFGCDFAADNLAGGGKTATFESLSDELKRISPHFEAVDHPQHYNAHPSGIECITITEHMNFNLGNAMKYLWRSDMKGHIEDLKKAIWYIEREVKRISGWKRNAETKGKESSNG